MSKTKLVASVIAIATKHALPGSSILPTSDLIVESLIDSIGFTSFIAELSNEYNVVLDFSNLDFEKVGSIEYLSSYLES